MEDQFKKIRFTKPETDYIQEAIEMLSLYSATLTYHNLHTNSTVEKILDRMYDKTSKHDRMEINEPGLVCFLVWVDTLNCFLINNKTEPFTRFEYEFFKRSDKFFSKYNTYNDINKTWREFQKYIYRQPVYAN